MPYIEQDHITRFKQILDQHSRFVILTHVNPDGDAIGSVLAMYFFLRSLGKKAIPITPTPYAAFLRWLPGHSDVLKYHYHNEKITSALHEAEVIFILDLNDPQRLGDIWPIVEQNTEATTVLIDHHPAPVGFCDLEVSDTRPSSTAELVFDLIQQIRPELLLDAHIATCIYTGIMTDTGCFSFNSSHPETFQAIATLLQADLQKDAIYDRVYNNFSESRMQLLGYALDQKMTVIQPYHTAYIALTADEMKQYDFKMGDSEGFVNMPLSIKGIHFSALFLEKDEHIKISFRSKGSFSVNEFSKAHFNGGGHLNAAGGEWYGSLDQALQQFKSLLPLYKNSLEYYD